MSSTNFDIFISYKRKSLPTANNLYYRLTTRGYSTFFDIEELRKDNYNTQLLNYIENAKDVFVILEEGSLDACKQDDWEKDWFCLEIALAIEKKKNIIPILLNGYTMPSEDFFPDKLKELHFKEAPEFNYSFFEAYLDKLIEKEFLLSQPNIHDKTTSVFKFYSNENSLVFKEGKLVCSLVGMSEEPYYLPVYRKGDYRFKAENNITSETKLIKEHIEVDEEKEIDIQWDESDVLEIGQKRFEIKVETPQSTKGSSGFLGEEDFSIKNDIFVEESVNISSPDDDYFSKDDILINIADKVTPLAVLLGPACVGKTMTLVRLVRYLVEQGYSVSPDKSFRSVGDNIYRNVCDSFQELINSGNAASGTSYYDCMLVKIMKDGRSILQVVDLAGELLMNYGLGTTFPYFHQILNVENPYIWIIMLEPYWRNPKQRREYVERIKSIQTMFSPKDKVIIVANKIDKTPYMEGKTRINSAGVLKQINNEYPGLIELFSNTNPITCLFRPYNCSFIPFVTGTYPIRNDGQMLYVPSSSVFPNLLWKAMIK